MLVFVINNALLLLFFLCAAMILISPYIKFYIPRWVLETVTGFDYLLATAVIILNLNSDIYTVGYFPDFGWFNILLAIVGYVFVYLAVFWQKYFLLETTMRRDKSYVIYTGGDCLRTYTKEPAEAILKYGPIGAMPVKVIFPEGYECLRDGYKSKVCNSENYVPARFVRRETGFGKPRIVMIVDEKEILQPKLVSGRIYDFHVQSKQWPRFVKFSDKDKYGYFIYETIGYVEVEGVKIYAYASSDRIYNFVKKGDTIPLVYVCKRSGREFFIRDEEHQQLYFDEEKRARFWEEYGNKDMTFFLCNKKVGKDEQGHKIYSSSGYVACGNSYLAVYSSDEAVYAAATPKRPVKVRLCKESMEKSNSSIFVCKAEKNPPKKKKRA